MKVSLYLLFIGLLTVSIAAACAKNNLPHTAAPKASVPSASTAVATPSGSQPVYGGTLKFVSAVGPQVLSYAPEMTVTDVAALFPGVESLLNYSDDRRVGNGLEPVLAESIDEDIQNRRIIFHIRKGVKFHDGSDLDADVVIWNYQQSINARAFLYLNYLKSIDKLDDMTVQFEYTEYNNRLLQVWGQLGIYSQAAWNKASGGDLNKGKEWARTHLVGTGPFILQEFVRDDHMVWVKNPNYWQTGRPYLEAIDVRYIVDPSTARAMMLSGESDYWVGAPVMMQREMVEKGYVGEPSWYGNTYSLWPNTSDPKSKWNDIRLRMAIEYALDKPTIARTFGLGYFKPMTTIVPEGEWGYDPNYAARGYDPDKAHQLLKEAGYPNGLPAKLLAGSDPTVQNVCATIKNYLDAVGFQIELDFAAPARLLVTVFGPQPGADLSFMWSGMDINSLGTYIDNFSSFSRMRYSYLGHPAEQKSMDLEAMKISDIAGQKAAAAKLMKYVADNALVIPVYWASMTIVTTPQVHPPQNSAGGFRWRTEDLWLNGP